MMGLSFPHLLILAVIVLVLFGGSGKISSMMGDIGKGFKSFKKGMAEEDEKPVAVEAPKAIDREKV